VILSIDFLDFIIK